MRPRTLAKNTPVSRRRRLRPSRPLMRSVGYARGATTAVQNPINWTGRTASVRKSTLPLVSASVGDRKGEALDIGFLLTPHNIPYPHINGR